MKHRFPEIKQKGTNTFIWFLFVATTFWLLDRFSISVGDDLGYMFADSALHKGDGLPIENIYQCFATQANHYFTTNGRFLVHVATHFFTAIAGLDIFRIVNSIMFALLWLATIKLSFHNISGTSEFKFVLPLFLLLIFIPDPGTTMFSLVAFAINYLWTAAAIFLFLIVLRHTATHNYRFKTGYHYYAILFVFAIVIGSLHESYSIPISLSLFCCLIFGYEKISSLPLTMILGFFIGAAISVFAPGNFHHAVQGGGFDFDDILRKTNALSSELLFSPITFIGIAVLILIFIKSKPAIRFIKENKFYFLTIISALILAIFTFTSSRQLFCPSVMAIILIAKLIHKAVLKHKSQQILTIAMSTTIAFIFIFAFYLRRNTYDNFCQITSQLGESHSILFADVSDANYNSPCPIIRLMARAYAPDPFEGENLYLLFDGYTKRGLSRVYWDNRQNNNIQNVIPYPAETVFDKVAPCDTLTYQSHENIIIPTIDLDNRYKAVYLPNRIINHKRYYPYASIKASHTLPYERFSYGKFTYYILPVSAPDSIVMK